MNRSGLWQVQICLQPHWEHIKFYRVVGMTLENWRSGIFAQPRVQTNVMRVSIASKLYSQLGGVLAVYISRYARACFPAQFVSRQMLKDLHPPAPARDTLIFLPIVK